MGWGSRLRSSYSFILLLSLYAEVVWARAKAALSGQGQLVGVGSLLSSVGPEDSTQLRCQTWWPFPAKPSHWPGRTPLNTENGSFFCGCFDLASLKLMAFFVPPPPK